MLHAFNYGSIDLYLVFPLILGSIVGVQLGQKVGQFLDSTELKSLFAMLLLCVAVAIGYDNYSYGLGATSLGYDNAAQSNYTTAIGYSNYVSSANGGVAIGYDNDTRAYYAISIGYSNYVNGTGAAALGYDHTVSGAYSCLLYTSPSPRDSLSSRMPSSA